MQHPSLIVKISHKLFVDFITKNTISKLFTDPMYDVLNDPIALFPVLVEPHRLLELKPLSNYAMSLFHYAQLVNVDY